MNYTANVSLRQSADGNDLLTVPKQFLYNGNMSANVDMTYRFVWDSEPTDEQLLVIMQEVGEEARRKSEQIAKQIVVNIERESNRIRSSLQLRQE